MIYVVDDNSVIDVAVINNVKRRIVRNRFKKYFRYIGKYIHHGLQLTPYKLYMMIDYCKYLHILSLDELEMIHIKFKILRKFLCDYDMTLDINVQIFINNKLSHSQLMFASEERWKLAYSIYKEIFMIAASLGYNIEVCK